MLKFLAKLPQIKLIVRIAQRAIKANQAIDFEKATMDLNVAHSNGCPLDFQKLFDFPPGDFNHDFYGIFANINRETGELENGFVPRCAMEEDLEKPNPGDVEEMLDQEWRTDEEDSDGDISDPSISQFD